MNSKVDPAFWRRFNALPLQVQQLARHAFALWLKDPFYSSFHFKKLKDDLWSIRIGDHYRATDYFLTSDTFVWNWIGTHEEYNREVEAG
jgi:hypothetical protein